MDIQFGFKEEWDGFGKRNALFLERWENLREAIHLTFDQGQTVVGPEDRVIYFLGRVCCEDFYEILLLAGNGYGFAAQKVLRGIYERAVTMTYLSQHPDEVDAFLNYHAIAQHKLAAAIRKSYGSEKLPKHMQKDVEVEYNKVKENYRVTDCKACGTTRINHTWSKLDFVTMAHRTGSLGKLIVQAYYIPLSQAHSTVWSVISRTEITETGLGFNPDAQPKEADSALRTAHNIILRVIEHQWTHFKMGQELLDQRAICNKDYMEIWGMKEDAEAMPGLA